MAKRQGTKEIIFADDIEIHTIELGKYKEGKEAKPEDNWIKFIQGGLDMDKNYTADEAIEEARKELERIMASPELREEYEERERDLRDKISIIASYRDKGLREGKEEEQKSVILNMHKKRIDIDTICEVVELSKEEVEKIIEEAK